MRALRAINAGTCVSMLEQLHAIEQAADQPASVVEAAAAAASPPSSGGARGRAVGADETTLLGLFPLLPTLLSGVPRPLRPHAPIPRPQPLLVPVSRQQLWQLAARTALRYGLNEEQRRVLARCVGWLTPTLPDASGGGGLQVRGMAREGCTERVLLLSPAPRRRR